MMAVLNLKMSQDQYPPPTGNPCNTNLKVGDLILIKNQAPQSAFDAKYKPSYHIVKKKGDKALDMQDPTGKIKSVCRAHTIHVPCGTLLESHPKERNLWKNY